MDHITVNKGTPRNNEPEIQESKRDLADEEEKIEFQVEQEDDSIRTGCHNEINNAKDNEPNH